MATLDINNVVKQFGKVEVIHDTSLSVKDGELMVFVGPSGCGKSTMLRMIAGLEELTAGEIKIGGKKVDRLPPAKRGIAMVFQSYALYPHKDVRGNLGFALRHAGMPKAEVTQRVDAAADILGLGPLMERRPSELSGGQRQRVAIGRAIVREPEVFLFDEPLSNLDAALRVHMRVEILKLHQRLKSTMIYVTHDQVEAMTLADRIVVFRDGCVEQIGTPLELYRNPANKFVAGFIGSPAMNFIDADVINGNAIHASEAIASVPSSSTKDANYTKVSIGIRPEDIQIQANGKWSGTVEVYEHLGGEAYLHVLLVDKQTVVARADADSHYRIGETVRFNVVQSKLHMFAEDGKAIPKT